MTPDQAKSLAQIEQKLDDLCASNTSQHDQLTLTQGDIYEKLDAGKTEMYQALNNRPKWSVVMWLMGGVFASMIIIGTMIYHLDDRLETHMDNARGIYQQLTGKIWTGDMKDVEPIKDPD